MDYYNKKIYLAKVDKKDKDCGKIERWAAHRQGVLHRAFTVCLFYEGQVVMQHRRHLVFDGVFDLTCSSHPVIVKEKIQADKDAAYDTLRREWSIAKINLKSKLNHEGSIYYKAEDPNSKYTEHEVCHLFVASTDKLPSPNFEFAYGFSLVLKDRLKTDYSLLIPNIAPWVPPLMKLL